ncbi:hypothetical protein ACG1BZ_21370 [Microbulbifer sp. CNSA002]|uniref:hypothetical protein n=1 Tax=Microbulbifer sp. CNSA002 TaxID=3373604 RepID=UPI0039B55251
MENTIYKSPESELEIKSPPKTLSSSERLAESRRQMEESNAIQTLNFVWGLRLAGNIIFILFFIVGLISSYNSTSIVTTGVLIFSILFFCTETFCILGYFRRKSWCQIPLHTFSAFSLLNIPFGTVFSILHYIKMPKVKFDD